MSCNKIFTNSYPAKKVVDIADDFFSGKESTTLLILLPLPTIPEGDPQGLYQSIP